ncbi:MAG: potassium transporter TrkH, partial [Pseudomonadota bacterium]
MFDLRPVAYVIGLLILALGAAMLVPFCVDLLGGEGDPATFGASAFLTATTGVCLTIACAPTK